MKIITEVVLKEDCGAFKIKVEACNNNVPEVQISDGSYNSLSNRMTTKDIRFFGQLLIEAAEKIEKDSDFKNK